MEKFKVWEDGKKEEAVMIEAESMNLALDIAAGSFGPFIDYADMVQNEEWREGLNIEEAAE